MKKILGGCAIFIFLFFVLILSMGDKFSAGTGQFYIEWYRVINNRDDVVAAIEKFKANNKEYVVPEYYSGDLHHKHVNDYDWSDFYFYYKDTKQIIYVSVKPAYGTLATSQSDITLNAIRDPYTGKWDGINNNLSWLKRRKEKKRFKNDVLREIRKILGS